VSNAVQFPETLLWKATALEHKTDFSKQQTVFRSKAVRTFLSSSTGRSLNSHTEHLGMVFNTSVSYPENNWFVSELRTTPHGKISVALGEVF
jgi:hypothetical protein